MSSVDWTSVDIMSLCGDAISDDRPSPPLYMGLFAASLPSDLMQSWAYNEFKDELEQELFPWS